jgi:hypothetical protein
MVFSNSEPKEKITMAKLQANIRNRRKMTIPTSSRKR